MKELILDNPRRRRRHRRIRRNEPNPAMKHRRHHRRSHSRRHHRTARFAVRSSLVKLNPFGLRGIFSKQTLAIAGGAVGASLVTNYAVGSALNRFLPMVNTPFGRAGYNALIPIAGALLVRKWVPNVATGMIIGGLANGIGQLVAATGVLPAGAIPQAPAVTALPAAGAVAPTGEYLQEYLGRESLADAVSAAFSTNAWAS